MTETKTKSNRTKQLLRVELEPTLLAWLKQYCAEQERHLNWVVTKALEQYRKEQAK